MWIWCQLFGKDSTVVTILNSSDTSSSTDVIPSPWMFYGCPVNLGIFKCLVTPSRRTEESEIPLSNPTLKKSNSTHHRFDQPISAATAHVVSNNNISNIINVNNVDNSLNKSAIDVTSRRLSSLYKFIREKFNSADFMTRSAGRIESPFVDPERRVDGLPPSAAPATYTLTDWWKLLPAEFQGKVQQAQLKLTSDSAILEDPQVKRFSHRLNHNRS